MRTQNLSAAIAFLFLALNLSACSAGDAPLPASDDLSPTEQQGYDLFNFHCAPCHALSPDSVIVGPSLVGIATRAGTRVEGQDAETYLRNSLLYPNDFILPGYPEAMPPDFGKRLSGEEFDSILAFLLSLN